MGQVDGRNLHFVSFEERDGGFVALVAVDVLLSSHGRLEEALHGASETYARSLSNMRRVLEGMRGYKVRRQPMPARLMWEFGDEVFRLKDRLAQLGFQMDGMYRHLQRDLGLSSRSLSKAVTFRRYLPSVSAIPESLEWLRCHDAEGRTARALREAAGSVGR